MKTLVLVFHPHLEKSQVNRKLMDAANETGDVTVVDEYAAYPDFKINVEHEQECPPALRRTPTRVKAAMCAPWRSCFPRSRPRSVIRMPHI